MIRVFIADDHAIVRQGLRKLLEELPDVEVIGEASDGRQVLQAEGKERWDVLLLDLSLPRVSGLEVLRRLREEQPGLRIVVLSMYPEDQFALRLVHEGAAAYVAKDQPAAELVEAIRRVARGRTYVSPDVKERALESEADPRKMPHASLSAREYQVFTLLFQGRTPTEIAAELDLSTSTVSNHMRRIKDKLGAHSIGEIVAYAHRVGLVG